MRAGKVTNLDKVKEQNYFIVTRVPMLQSMIKTLIYRTEYWDYSYEKFEDVINITINIHKVYIGNSLIYEGR